METVSSRAFQGDISTERRINEEWGEKIRVYPFLSLSLDVDVMLVPVGPTYFLSSFFLCVFPLSTLSVPFIMSGSLCVAPEKVLWVHDVMK